MIAELKFIGPLSQRIWASEPPAALDAFESANRRLRRRGGVGRPQAEGKKRGQKSVPSETTERGGAAEQVGTDIEGRFMAEIGAVPVAEILVSKNMISAARNAAVQASAELGTSAPRVRWFRNLKGTGQVARGWFCSSFPDSIWIAASLSTEKVPSVVRHECKHRADSLAGRSMSEESAGAFAGRLDQPSDSRAYAPRPTTFLHPPLSGVWT